MNIKRGDYVEYNPVQIPEDTATKGVVSQTMDAGSFFNQDMLCIDTVNHWIPARECTPETELAKAIRLGRGTPAPVPLKGYA